VFKHSIRSPTDEELSRLSSSLGRYGDNNLLLVLDEKDYTFPDPVHLLLPHVWVSCIDFTRDIEQYRLGAWMALCQMAHRLIPHHRV
jgi:hypothetical protein